MNNIEKLIREYLIDGQTRMMQVATCVDNKPWICTVYYAVDEDLNLYWMSKPERRHSEEIIQNSTIVATVVHDQQPPRKDHRSVTIEGTAQELSGAEALKPILLYGKQLASPKEWIQAVKLATDPHKIYKLKPSKFVIFDDVNFPENPKQEWALGE